MQDRHGRSGVACTRRGDGGDLGQQHLIVDAANGRALALESWSIPANGPGTLMSWTVQIRSGFTDDTPPAA
ncbi:hypothetical protein [Dactylosporangium sp. NPDC005555]|uniref:hypothetical protein n=1 Tax=Dactylosporangium sp. NPDC005555 TaxID=3154889 RepID=UPI0033BE8537